MDGDAAKRPGIQRVFGRGGILFFRAKEGGARVAVWEVKRSRTLQDMEGDCEKALKQIDEKRYAGDWEEEYEQVICYGISFYKKRCRVQKKQA